MSWACRIVLLFLMLTGAAASCGSNDLDPIVAPAIANMDAAVVDAGRAEAGSEDDAMFSDSSGEMQADVADGSNLPCKRGIAANNAPSAAFAPSPLSPGISWWYNWDHQPAAGGDPRIEYVPMIWGGGSLNQSVPAGSQALLGFNEPNFKSQANLTVQQAAADWPAVETIARAAGVPFIVSPAVNYCGSASNTSQCTDPAITDPYTYLKDFFAACAGCKVDYIAVHAYACDVASLRAYLEGDVQEGGTQQGFLQFGKPIWVTEFACNASASVAQQKAFMQASVPYLESSPYVSRYAWFNAHPIPNALLTNADGTLTDLGTTYVSLPASCP